MSEDRSDAPVRTALTKLTEVLRTAADNCPPEKANDFFFVEAALAEEINLAVADGRLMAEDLALIVAYQTLYLTTLQQLGQELVSSIEPAVDHNFSNSSDGPLN